MLALLGTTGCFIGYDSRWGQQKQAQQHFAAAQMPSQLEAAPSGSGRAALGPAHAEHRLRIRVEATPTYAAEILDWRRRFEDTVVTANAVVGPALGIGLELVDASAWSAPGSEDHIKELLERLRDTDPGEDVDLVIGLAGAVPRFEESFHELGMATVAGKHIVLRAISNAAEFSAIERGLGELSPDERAKLRRVRLEHKTSSVLLHELGHTFGALHERDPANLMNPRYSLHESHFSTDAVDLMRIVLAHRTPTGRPDDAGRTALRERLQREPSPWDPADRDELLLSLTPPGAKRGPHPATAATEPSAGLPPADESIYEAATQALARGDTNAASRTAEPLFAKYPAVHAVAELRCNIALRRGLPWGETHRECAALMQGVSTFH
jgi:hypothetical protein